MVAQPKIIPVVPDSELDRLLDEAAATPVVLERAGERFRIVREEREAGLASDDEDPFANYDPERVRAAFDRAAGILKGLDVDAFLEEIREQRDQDSVGRPRW